MLFEYNNDYTSVKLNYSSKVDFFVGRVIEYDIKSAYFSILNEARINNALPISEEDFLYLESIKDNKQERLVFVGNLMLKYTSLSDFLHNSLRYILTTFYLMNNLKEEDVLSVKKDAIFVTKSCPFTKLNSIELTEKHSYKVYFSYKITTGKYKGFIEYYIKDSNNFDIKGLPKNLLENNKEFFSCVVKQIYKTALMNDRTSLLLCLEHLEKEFLTVPTFDEKKRLKLNNGFAVLLQNNELGEIDRSLLYNKRYYNLFFKPYETKLLQLNL